MRCIMEYKELTGKIDTKLIERLSLDSKNIDGQLFNRLTDNIEIELIGDANKDFMIFNRSVKVSNVRINFKGIIAFLAENALALGLSYDSLDTFKISLLIIIDIINLVSNISVKLDKNMLSIVYYLHENNAYNKGLSIKKVKEKTQLGQKWDIVINDLIRLNIVQIKNNTIKLLEKVLIKMR